MVYTEKIKFASNLQFTSIDTRPKVKVYLLPQKHMWVLCTFPIDRTSTSQQSKYKLQYKRLLLNFLSSNPALTKIYKFKLIQEGIYIF